MLRKALLRTAVATSLAAARRRLCRPTTAGRTRAATTKNGGTTADQVSWTNMSGSAVNIYALVWHYASTLVERQTHDTNRRYR